MGLSQAHWRARRSFCFLPVRSGPRVARCSLSELFLSFFSGMMEEEAGHLRLYGALHFGTVAGLKVLIHFTF